MMAADSAAIERGNLTYLPAVPGRLEFALHVRRQILQLRPKAIAIELPGSLEKQYAAAVERLPQMSVIVIPATGNDEEDQATFIPIEPADPFIEALRTAREIGAELVYLGPDASIAAHIPGLYADSYVAQLAGIGEYVGRYLRHPPLNNAPVNAHASAMAWKLQGADPSLQTCVVVGLNTTNALLTAMELPQEEPPPPRTRLFGRPELCNLHPDCLAEITNEIPYYQERYEDLRTGNLETAAIEKAKWQLALLREAEREYSINTGDQMNSWQRMGLAKFGRNLALLDQQLLPGVFDLTLAARALVDDNFAYEVWQTANRFAVQQTEDPPLETLNLSGEEVWLHTRKLRIRRRLPRARQRLLPRSLKLRKREKKAGEWARQTNGTSICSYPPEDLVIENYGRFLKKYAKHLLSEERARVEPFTTSTLDGIDLRETIRNWHEGKLYVREMGKFSGDVGALVIVFDEDRNDRYHYLTTWLGEHQNESDMAFYSTEPFEHIVGPGIGRAEYGGLLMTLPPRRMYDIWSDFEYEAAETKAERLLMAALDYSVEQHVVYVAARPPRSIFRRLAARMNRKIVYVPLGQLSPSKLKRIRVVHVLDNHSRRGDAKQYIW
jgi:hypothetical protein